MFFRTHVKISEVTYDFSPGMFVVREVYFKCSYQYLCFKHSVLRHLQNSVRSFHSRTRDLDTVPERTRQNYYDLGPKPSSPFKAQTVRNKTLFLKCGFLNDIEIRRKNSNVFPPISVSL
jgi:hypothetical protein